MFHVFRRHADESVAVSALIAASASLHAAWIANLAWFRFQNSGTSFPLYLFVASVYAVTFALAYVFCRRRDASALRDQAFHSFVVAAIIFVAMTLPIVYGFAV
ncbi:hypothetical protein EBS80_02545 [bacterium]|nr:hypothetical protein [bacterium]